MKHLHFVQSLEPLYGAGLGAAALGLHLELERAGFPSHLVSTREADFTGSWPGVIQCVRSGPRRAFHAPGLAHALGSLPFRPDAVHGHGFYVYPNYLVGSWARRQGIPLVYHPHGFLDPWIASRSRLKKRLAHLLFEDRNFRAARLWRALTGKEADQIRAHGVTAPVEVIPNGVACPPAPGPEERFLTETRFPKQRPRRAVFLSRLHPKKGVDLLLEAWAALPTETRDWELALFGPDENGHQEELESLRDRLGLNGSCRFLGPVGGPAKHAAFRSGDLFVLPSRSEGFPMAVLEASAHGLPVVMTDECNFPPLTQAGGAWECRPDTASVRAALAQALRASDEERHQRGAAGLALVTRGYTWEQVARRMDEACAAAAPRD
jgi:glycosyltransferase involved in cell wall biosynthesis